MDRLTYPQSAHTPLIGYIHTTCVHTYARLIGYTHIYPTSYPTADAPAVPTWQRRHTPTPRVPPAPVRRPPPPPDGRTATTTTGSRERVPGLRRRSRRRGHLWRRRHGAGGGQAVRGGRRGGTEPAAAVHDGVGAGGAAGDRCVAFRCPCMLFAS